MCQDRSELRGRRRVWGWSLIVDIVDRRHNSQSAPKAACLPFWQADGAAIGRLNPAL
jgi:hypothetical protein